METALERIDAGLELAFATVLAETGTAVGSTRFLALRPEHRSLEIGWTWLAPSAWGTGANTEAKLLQLEHAFDVLGCRRVEFKTDALNERARPALAALPARFEGIHRKHMLVRDGENRDSAWYSVVDDEWPAVRERSGNARRRLTGRSGGASAPFGAHGCIVRSMATRVAFRTCPLCEATCGLRIETEDGHVTRIRGDAEDPFSKGFICPKGSTLGALHDDPDRLRRPLVRRNGVHEEVSWEEAFAEVERRLTAVLATHGRDAVAVYVGNPNAHNFANTLAIRPLVKALGTKNVYSASTVDQMPKHVSCGLVFGHPLAIPVPDIDRTDFLLILGANPLESNGSLATAPDWPGRLDCDPARGGRVVVVDPRRTRTAERADLHVPIRPGTDAALLAGIAQTLFAEGLVAPGRLSELTNGIDEVEAGRGRLHAGARRVVHGRSRRDAWSRSPASSRRRRRPPSTGAWGLTRPPTARSLPGSSTC